MNTRMKSYPYPIEYEISKTQSATLILYRLFDLFFSSIAILVLAPLFLTVAVILKVKNDDKVFYLQERIGRGGKPFYVYKFTTMVKNSESMGSGTITLKNDSRVFPFGKFLRKTKINELPQLFNIFKGDMSIIGPRPLPMERYRTYSDEVKHNINKVLPGLSGIGSVLFRNEEEILSKVSAEDKVSFYDNVIAPYKGAVEIWFVQNLSLYLYFMTILLTAFAVIRPNTKVNYRKLFKDLPVPPKELEGLV